MIDLLTGTVLVIAPVKLTVTLCGGAPSKSNPGAVIKRLAS